MLNVAFLVLPDLWLPESKDKCGRVNAWRHFPHFWRRCQAAEIDSARKTVDDCEGGKHESQDDDFDELSGF
jgi:hypothetical protein